MDTTTTEPKHTGQQIDEWHVGDKCLAPFSDSLKLSEARIHSIESDEHGKTFAVVLFAGSEKKHISLTQLCKIQDSKDPWKSIIFDDEDLEKPFFPDKGHSGPAVAFNLSDEGDCIPYTINRYLRVYQREGVQFMYKHYIQSRGCILGDDMGLGKTIQVISLLAALLHKKGTREDIENNMPEFLLRKIKKESSSVIPKKMFLIVAPLSVLYNWKDELDTWGYFRVITLHGNKKDTNLIRVKQGKCEIALTTYETLRLCLDELNSIEWSAVIVDEAHRIKNPKAQVTQVMKDLKCKVRIGLTGTILQNNMEELWCVLDWAMPGCLGSRTQFKAQFSSPVEYGQRHTATKRELATGRKAMQRLIRKISGFFLRRTKAIISHQLPKKEDRIVYCSLTDFQREVYQTVLETEDVSLVLRAQEPCSCDSGRKRKNCCYKKNSYGETVSVLYFSYLAILRKVANHAALLQTDNSTSKKQDTLIKRVCSQVFSKFPDFVKQSKDAAFETISDPIYSGKMKVLQQLLNHFRKNKDKVLLFSFSTKLLDVLEQYCMASGLDYRRLDGSTKPEERVKIVKEFNSTQDVNICLVSTMAGGLGLNFVGANVVVVFDPTWNPANDLQAIDRAYRIGQCRDVKVFRLISLGTVEEIVYLRQVYKQQLHCVVVGSENAKRYFEAVQGSKEHQGELFGVHNLLKLRARGSCLTREILEREGQVEAGFVTSTTRLREDITEKKIQLPVELEGEEKDNRQLGGEVDIETFDFNSDSEEEANTNSKTKAIKSKVSNANSAFNSREQLTLLQCGFSKLLEKACKSPKEDTDRCILTDDKCSGNKTAGQKGDKNVKINAEKCTLEHQKHADSSKQSPERVAVQVRKHAPNWTFLSDSEVENEIGVKIQDPKISTGFNVVMETEGSSDGSSDVILPSQVLLEQKKVPPKMSETYETTSGESEDSDAEKRIAAMRGHRQGASTELAFPNARSFFGKTKSSHMVSAQKARGLRGLGDISDESDDIEISAEPQARKLSSSTSRQKKDTLRMSFHKRNSETNSQTIDDFSSSEEDLPARKVKFVKRDQRQKRRRSTIQMELASPTNITDRNVVAPIQPNPSTRQNTSSKESTTVRREADVGSLDQILDGVQEVAYIHSNQNVVGSSKAENHMSRRAVRDVFELKQFSQFPANAAVSISQKSEEISDEDTLLAKKRKEINENFEQINLYVTHPVIQKDKRVHQTGPTTFLIGETPKGIRRTQLEKMVSYFQMTSAKELAEKIVTVRSENRQQMLKDFYVSQWPDLKEQFTIQVPVELASNFENAEKYRLNSRRKKSTAKERNSVSRLTDGQCSSGTAASFRQKQHQSRAVTLNYDSVTSKDVCLHIGEREMSSRVIQDNASQEISNTSEDTVPSPGSIRKSVREDFSVGVSGEDILHTKSPRRESLCKLEIKKTANKAAEKHSITDLIGDTSILNDLFRSHGSTHATSARLSHPELPAMKAKTRPKDFWDILNEQNDESFSKLTDLSVVKEVCERASFTVAKKKEELDTSLWKKNETFLWRKYDPMNDGDQDLSDT